MTTNTIKKFIAEYKLLPEDELKELKKEYATKLTWLNGVNGANILLAEYAKMVANKYKKPVFVEMGSCYGGGCEWIGKLFKDQGGQVYGFDTFTGLPKQLAKNKEERDCMDYWYEEDVLGTKGLDYDYQRKILDEMGLDNVTLIKGLINRNSCKDIDKIHLAFLDLDLTRSMQIAYSSVKDKIVKGGYLLMHDACSTTHLHNNYLWVKRSVISDKKRWKYIGEWSTELTIAFQRV